MNLAKALQRRIAISILNLPPLILRRIAGPPRRSPDGLTLDLQMQTIIRIGERSNAFSFYQLPVSEARRRMAEGSDLLCIQPAGMLAVRDQDIPVAGGTIQVRIYTPQGAQSPLPMVVYYHGGGWVLGSPETHDGQCRSIALDAGAIVVSVDYRLAPEHPFPTAVEDGIAAYRWVVEHAVRLGGNPHRIAVAGDSAGGNIAAVVAQQTRGDAVQPVYQMLIYPALDMTRSGDSHRLFREGGTLDKAALDWYLAHYLAGADPTHPLASPVFAHDLAGVAPALIVTAGFDPVRDDGAAYAKRLREAGVPTEYRCFESLAHGYHGTTLAVEAARRAFAFAVERLRSALS